MCVVHAVSRPKFGARSRVHPFLCSDFCSCSSTANTADSLTSCACRWAVQVEPRNEALRKRLQEVQLTRAYDGPTVPFKLESERQTNPFLRPDSAAIRAVLDLMEASNQEVFAALRRHKDAQAGWLGWAAMQLHPLASYLRLA